MRIDVQLSAAVAPWPALRDGVRLAEERGFDTAWVYDHLDGSMLGGTTMLECFALLGGLAASTERIGLGTLVVNVVNRFPAVTAQSAATVQAMSGGRLMLGLGAGAAPGSRWSAEHERLGIELAPTMAERHANVERTLDEMDRLWDPGRPEELAAILLPDPRPPVVLGVSSERLARLAGRRCDGINARGDHPRLPDLVAAAEEGRREAARTDAPWDCSVWAMWDPALLRADHPDRVRWASLGVSRLVLVWLSAFDRRDLVAAVPER